MTIPQNLEVTSFSDNGTSQVTLDEELGDSSLSDDLHSQRPGVSHDHYDDVDRLLREMGKNANGKRIETKFGEHLFRGKIQEYRDPKIDP